MSDEPQKPQAPQIDIEALERIEEALFQQRKAQAARMRTLSPNNALLDYVLKRRGV